MKLKVTLVLSGGEERDITLSCDVTATVSETARALIRADASADPQLREIAAQRLVPVTLRGRPSRDAAPLLLDPAAPIGASGLQSGWLIEPIPEFGPRSEGRRLTEVAGFVEVLSGPQAGVLFSLVAGENLIGRDPGCRVHLHDGSVSRRHARIEIGAGAGGGIVLRDLDSANGVLVDGEAVAERRIADACEVGLGEIGLRIVPGPPVSVPRRLSHRVAHLRAPRVAPSFPESRRELPAPPTPAESGRLPVLAMLAPMLMGGVIFAVTQSPLSLMMVAFSPLMMLGSWLEGRSGGRRRLRRELARFASGLAQERAELAALRDREIEIRAAETPTLSQITAAIRGSGNLLWARRPEHRSFLEVRFGEGSLPSRTELVLPPRGGASKEQWEALQRVEAEFHDASPVPVLERFERCGSIGVTGERIRAEGLARSLVMQLVGLHSPAELVLACFAASGHAESWSWLKWLPHVDAVTSPLSAWQLADDPGSSARLVMALEGLLEARQASRGGRRTVRSHLDANTRNDDGQGEAIREIPALPAVLVLVLDDGQIDRSRLIALAEEGPDAGIHLLWVSCDGAPVPAACRTFVELGQTEGRASFVRTGATVPLSRLEHLESTAAVELARRLAPVEDTGIRALDESDLPKTVQLRELHEADVIGGAPPIIRAWERSGSLTSRWRPGAEQDPLALAAVVGQGPDGPAVIDLRVHGPHALVGGTTGAGKSEFLQTWIMSLAARISPDRLNFLLVDYKGGAAFAECADLPHSVGLVTDLSPHLVRRALTSLRAELHYREELLARRGAKDLVALERRSDPAAPPVLVIVIDEFAALANEVPEFVDGVIDIAQRGRSLGLHLILATQRPAGVIRQNLRANTNLRVALRTADEADSADVLGVTDAAFFDAETPGRGAIKVGPGKIDHFQAGYLGGQASAVSLESRIEVRSLGFVEGEPWDAPPEPHRTRKGRGKPPRDIEQLRDGIIAAARLAGVAAPRRPWLDALPKVIDLAVVRERTAVPDDTEISPGRAETPRDSAVLIGLRDEPSAQAQRPVAVDFEEAGNIAVFGAGGAGKTSALITLAASLSIRAERFPAHLYAIDAGGGALDALSVLPTVGAVAPLSDTELVRRILRRALDVIAERGPRYAAVRAGGLSAYRGIPGGEREPRVVLLVDGFGAFHQATEALGGIVSPFRMLNEIMMTGRAVGVHVVVTSDRASAIPSSMASSLQRRFVLRLANAHDYDYLGVRSDVLEDAPPGRALLAGASEEIHIALLDGIPELAGQAQALERLAAELRARGVPQATEVRHAPETVPLAALPAAAQGKPVYGIDTQTFAPATLPIRGLGVISGPAGSGQSTAALACARAVERWALGRGERVEKILLTFAPQGLRSFEAWDRTAFGEEEVRSLAQRLAIALGGKPTAAVRPQTIIGDPLASSPRPVLAAHAKPLVFPREGYRGVVVVERPAEAEGTPALPALVALAKAARRAGALVLFEFEQGAGSGIWDLFTALKQPSWGLALQPDDGEAQTPFRESFGRVKRADFTLGRGFAVERGRITPVQVALPQE